MKISEAMLKGFKRVDGRVCRNRGYRQGPIDRPDSVCAIGAVMLATQGRASVETQRDVEMQDQLTGAFTAAWGIDIRTLNDDDELPAEHLYGMTVAAGL